MRQQDVLEPPAGLVVLHYRHGRRVGQMGDEDRQAPQRQADTPGLVASPAVPVIDPVDGLEVGLHRARVVPEQTEKPDQFPVDSRPIAFAYSENRPA